MSLLWNVVLHLNCVCTMYVPMWYLSVGLPNDFRNSVIITASLLLHTIKGSAHGILMTSFADCKHVLLCFYQGLCLGSSLLYVDNKYGNLFLL